MNYYNEYEPKTAAWLRELIKVGAIPDGHVDERSIAEVSPDDLRGFTQCHFFAGIGGWSLALQLAGWSSDRPVWTGSCPCQPFSSAGKGLGAADERHLWPVFFELIRKCRPEHVFGEQVEGAVGKGWLDGICGDLEGEGYACGSAVLGAHSVGAPHIRQRLYWVADSTNGGRELLTTERGIDGALDGEAEEIANAGSRCDSGGVADAKGGGREDGPPVHGSERAVGAAGEVRRERIGYQCDIGGVAHPESARNGRGSGATREAERGQIGDLHGEPRGAEQAGGMADNDLRGLMDSEQRGQHPARDGSQQSPWSSFRVIHCRDGKYRRIPLEPAFFPLAHGLPARVVRLRGYGNAIVPQCAQAFIEAFLDIQNENMHKM